MNKNGYALFTVAFLSLILIASVIVYPPHRENYQYVNTFGETEIENEGVYIYVNHTIDYIENETDGKWIISGNDTFFEAYRIVTEYVIVLNRSVINATADGKLIGDAFFTLNVTLSVYDKNAKRYNVFDLPLIYTAFNLSDDDVINGEENVTIHGSHTSEWFTPNDFNNSYRVIYYFSSNYKLLVAIDGKITADVTSETYLLPFIIELSYNGDLIISKWWITTAVIIGTGSAILSIYKKKRIKTSS